MMKSKTNIWLTLFVMVLISLNFPLTAQTSHWVSAYYAGWLQSSGVGCDNGHLPSSSIDYEAVTHIIHFAVHPDTNGTIIRVNNMTDCNMD